MDLWAEPSPQPTGENEYVLFSVTVDLAEPAIGSSLVNPTDPRGLGNQNGLVNQQRLQSLKTNLKYKNTASTFLKYGAELRLVGNTQGNFKNPIRKKQGCVSPYLIRSGRPAAAQI